MILCEETHSIVGQLQNKRSKEKIPFTKKKTFVNCSPEGELADMTEVKTPMYMTISF